MEVSIRKTEVSDWKLEVGSEEKDMGSRNVRSSQITLTSYF